MRETAATFLFFLASAAVAMPAQIILIRHGEKHKHSNELSHRGRDRAAALVSFFESNKSVNKFGKIAAIYAMKPKDADGSLRPIETVEPLAHSLGLQVLAKYERRDIQPLVAEILSNKNYDGRTVLICWEHSMIPLIAALLGGSPAPGDWPSTVYDQVWEIRFSGGRVTGFRKFSEDVLPGDGP